MLLLPEPGQALWHGCEPRQARHILVAFNDDEAAAEEKATALVARIEGEVSQEMLASAASKVQQRHPNLRVRIEEDAEHRPWFTSEGAGEIPIEVVPRTSPDRWIRVYHEACRIPFEFDKRPAIRFILVQSPDQSELIILCHHIICDGLSLAYLARDVMVHLGDPSREVEILPDPIPVDLDSMPEDVSLNGITRFFIKRINKKWRANPTFFDRARPSGNMQVGGLFVGKDFTTIFPVENVFDAPLYEKMQRQLLEVDREEALSVGSLWRYGKKGVAVH